MLGETLLDSSDSRRSSFRPRRWLTAVGVMVEAMLIGALALAPLMSVGALPKIVWSIPDYFPRGQGSAGGAARVAVAPKSQRQVSVQPSIQVPIIVPSTIAKGDVLAPQPFTVSNQIAGAGPLAGSGGSGNGGAGFPWGWNIIAANVPPAPKPPARQRVRVGGNVEAARLIFGLKPEYPQLARMARIEGTVRLEAIIDKDGTVRELHAVSGPPLLVQAALDAVSRWRYQPTLLNGEPVEVLTEIDVRFTLGE